MTPARTNDDLPTPDGPITAQSEVSRRRVVTLSTS
jgi:hypothetical protein